MKRLLFAITIVVLVFPMYGPVFGQDESIDVSSILNGLGGNNRGGNRGGGRGNNFPQVPDGPTMLKDVQDVLKKGKTPLENPQVKPVKLLIDTELAGISDKFALLRNNNNNGNNNGFPGNFNGNDNGGNTGNRGNRGTQGNQPNAQANQPSEKEKQVDTVTGLFDDNFVDTQLSNFLTPDQVALVKKAHADDKANANCLGGLFDRYYQQTQNPNRGNNNNNNSNNNNQNRNNSNALRPNGQKYCMTMEATPADRLEPIRKVLAKGNLPLAKDKDALAEVFMKAALQDLETHLRADLPSNNTGRGNNNNNNNNNRNNDPRQMITSSMDNIYRKIEAMLNPPQAETLKTWHYTQMLDRGGIETLIAVNAMQDTPLSDDQVTKVTAAWPELRTQIQQAAKAANHPITDKERDAAAMGKILDMLDSSQVASYQLAKKYGAQAAAGGKN